MERTGRPTAWLGGRTRTQKCVREPSACYVIEIIVTIPAGWAKVRQQRPFTFELRVENTHLGARISPDDTGVEVRAASGPGCPICLGDRIRTAKCPIRCARIYEFAMDRDGSAYSCGGRAGLQSESVHLIRHMDMGLRRFYRISATRRTDTRQPAFGYP